MEIHIGKSQSSFEVADALRASTVRRFLSGQESKVVNSIINCRTEALGGHLYACDGCGTEHAVYNSCSNRHCPKCQYLARQRWIEARTEELLPIQYFHVVFTIPYELRILFLQNKRLCFKMLFKASQETVQQVAEKKLKVKIGGTSVLHTWTQQLEFHPHVHMIVTGGGLSTDGPEWVSAKKDYFVSVEALSQVFRGKLLNLLERSFSKLEFKGELEHIKSEAQYKDFLKLATKHNWVVYAKAPFAGPKQVIDYLGNYTHRIAISNARIQNIEDGFVTFTYKDRREDDQVRDLILNVDEFTRRFLTHVLPKGLVRIRHFGILARRSKKKNLEICRAYFKVNTPKKQEKINWIEYIKSHIGVDPTICRSCKVGKLIVIATYPSLLKKRKVCDTS